MNILFFETISSSWVVYSFLGMLLLGIAMVFYKLPSTRKDVDANGLNVWSSFFFLALAILFFLPLTNFSLGNLVLIVALVQGVIFTLQAILQMHGLKYSSTNALFPTTSTAALLVVIVVGLLFYGDTLSVMQTLGVVLSVIVLFMFAFKGGKLTFSSIDAVKIWIGIVILSALRNLSNKVGADLGDIYSFLFFVYVFGFISSVAMLFIQKRNELKKVIHSKGAMFGGLGIGIFGFFGAWALIIALTKGPVSVAQTINSSYVIVTALLSTVFFGEILTKKKIILIVLGVIALGFIRLGS